MVRPVRFGIVGTGKISERFAAAVFRTRGAELTAVYSRKHDTGAAFSSRTAPVRVFSDYEEFLGFPDTDAVYIASPILFHEAQTLAALRAGKHVLCEKSLTTDLPSALRMRDEAEKQGKVLIEAMRTAYDPAFSLLRETLPRLGTVRRVFLEYAQYSSRYDAFLSGEVKNAFDPSLKNSALSDIGVYPLHLCLALFGAPLSLDSRSVFLHNGFEGEGTVLLRYPAFCAEISYSKIRQGSVPSVIEGENATLTLDAVNPPKSILFTDKTGTAIPLPLTPATPDNMHLELEAFLSMIRGETDPAPHLAATLLTMEMMDRVVKNSHIFG